MALCVIPDVHVADKHWQLSENAPILKANLEEEVGDTLSDCLDAECSASSRALRSANVLESIFGVYSPGVELLVFSDD